MYGRSRDHARSSPFTGGTQHVRISRENNRGSRQARRNDRNTQGERSRHARLPQHVVAKDSTDENVVWVTEVWESATSHDASLSLPSVAKSMPRVKPMIAAFDKIAITTPIWGLGLPSTHPK